MAITKNAGRQNLLYAVQTIAFDAIDADGAYDAVDLPVGARFISGALVEDVAFDDGTGTTLSVGISGGAADAYLAATSVQQGAGTTTALTGGNAAALAAKQTINVTVAYTDDDATTGQATLIVAYVIEGRAVEAQ